MGSKQDYLFLRTGQYLCRGRFFFSAISQLQTAASFFFFYFFSLFIFISLPLLPALLEKGILLSELPNWVTQTLHSSAADAVRLCVCACLCVLPLLPPSSPAPPPPPSSLCAPALRMAREKRTMPVRLRARAPRPDRHCIPPPPRVCVVVVCVDGVRVCGGARHSKLLPPARPQAWARRTTPS